MISRPRRRAPYVSSDAKEVICGRAYIIHGKDKEMNRDEVKASHNAYPQEEGLSCVQNV